MERILLASVQYRQGPVTALFHGFTQLIADGVKIYSKYSLDLLTWGTGLIVVGITLTLYVGLGMLVYSSSLAPALTSDVDLLAYVGLTSILGCLCLLPMLLVSNRYVSLGCLRQLRALIVADLGIESYLLLALLLLIT